MNLGREFSGPDRSSVLLLFLRNRLAAAAVARCRWSWSSPTNDNVCVSTPPCGAKVWETFGGNLLSMCERSAVTTSMIVFLCFRDRMNQVRKIATTGVREKIVRERKRELKENSLQYTILQQRKENKHTSIEHLHAYVYAFHHRSGVIRWFVWNGVLKRVNTCWFRYT